MQLGILLTIIGLLLLIGWLIGGRKHIMWRNSGLIIGGVGIIILVVGLVLYFATT